MVSDLDALIITDTLRALVKWPLNFGKIRKMRYFHLRFVPIRLVEDYLGK